MGKVLNVELHDDLFRAVHRVHSFNKNLTPALIDSEPGHRETYFWASIDGKDRWMTKTQKIDVNEHCPDNKQFLAALKKVSKDTGYVFVWCHEGKYFFQTKLKMGKQYQFMGFGES
ncbi:hypothetical protein J6590_076606 [Homalodisca vitripennis]|nr:hypothetical protein J6590_076606 [Homalodisca vitripennis]